VVLPLANAYGWFVVSQLWLAGVLTYILARVLGLRRSSSAAAGLIFQGSGFLLVSSAVFPMILAAAVWLPLLLACIEKIIRNNLQQEGAGKSLPWAALGSIVLGIQILAGHIEITYYTLLVMAFFALWRLVSLSILARREASDSTSPWSLRSIKAAGWLASFVIVGLMFGAIQFLPFLEVGQANFREGSATFEQVRGWGFPPRRILTLAMPDFFGNPADGQYLDVFSWESTQFTTNYFGEVNPNGPYTSDWGIKNYVEGGVYLGIMALILAGFGLWSAVRQRPDRRTEIAFFGLLCFLSLSFIFGTPLYALLYYGLPGINQLHSPFRWVFPFSLGIAMLAGYGFDFLAEKRREHIEAKKGQSGPDSPTSKSIIKPVAYLVVILAIVILIGLVGSRLLYSELEPTFERLFLSFARAAEAFPSTQAFYSHISRQALVMAIFLLASGIGLWLSQQVGLWLSQQLSQQARPRLGRHFWIIFILLIIAADLLVAGYGFNASVDPALLAYKPELLQWLEDQPGLWRLTTFTPHGDKPLNANTAWSYELQDARGYDSIILKQYADFMGAIEPQDELQFNRIQPVADWQSLNSPLLDLLGIKYIISSEEIDLPKLKPLWNGEGLIVYENLAAVPRAYTIPLDTSLVSEEPLSAMERFDPRQYTIIASQDWPRDPPQTPVRAPVRAPSPGQFSPANIIAYDNLEVIVEADVDEPSWLILNDTYFTGWDAFIRRAEPPDSEPGQEAAQEITRVNGNFRGVVLEPGHWQVRFRYSPLSFKLGGLISFMAVIVITFAFSVWTWRRIYRPSGPLTDTTSIAKNSLAPMALNLFNKGIDFVFAAFYLRLLGPANAGSYATAIIIAGWFEIISNWGLNTLVIREVSKDKSQASRYLLNTSVLRVGTAVIGALPIIIYLAVVQFSANPLDQTTTIAIILLMIGMIFSGIGQGLAGLFYAFETAEYPAAITTVSTILKVALGVIVLLLGYSFAGLAAVSIVVNLITMIILIVGAFRLFPLRGPWFVDLSLQRRMLVLSYPLMLNHLLAVIFFQIDIPLMRQINGEETVGWYNSAYKWVNAFNIIPSFFTFALFPVISRQVQSSITSATRTFRLSIKIMLLLSLPLAAFTTLLAPIMIGLLGGREFLPNGAIALQIVIWSIPIGWLNSVTNYVLISLGLEKRLTTAFIVGVGFNIGANLIFLPLFGIVAASIITILSELLLLLLFAYYIKGSMQDIGWVKIIKRPLVLTAVMIWAIVIGSQIHLIVGLILGVLAYFGSIWALKLFGQEERQILATVLPANVASRFSLDERPPTSSGT
jgi:O-antigen/teichoic acid export membrane protein